MTDATRPSSAVPAALALALAAPAALGANPFADQPKADDVFYHIMPIAWRDGNDDPNRFGDLIGVRDGLGYLEWLGATAIWMNPVFPSPAYHGYQHGAADTINPWFGTEQDFTDLLTDANSRGIEVYIDFVVYGISRLSTWYQDAFANPGSQYDDWLAFTNGSNTSSQGYSFSTWNGDSVGFTHWDLRTPEASDLVTSWALKWLDPNGDDDFSDGVAGYRLDHVWVNYGSGPDGWGYNLDDFWADWHAALRAKNPGVFTFAEQHNWGSHGGELLPQFDAAMTKPFEFAARDALRFEDAGPLIFQMEQTINSLPAGIGTYVAIIGDHDVDRLATAIGADSPATIGRLEAAAAVLMLQPFPPIVYYGDEIGMTGWKGNYGSDANDIPMREPFKWNAVEGAPMSRYHLLNGPATANQFSGDNDGRSVEEQQTSGPLDAHRELIAQRRAHVALRRGSYDAVDASSASVWAFLRRYEQGEAPIADATQALLCVVNLAGSPRVTTLDLSPYLPSGATLPASDIAPGGAGALPDITGANAGAYQVTVPAYGYMLIQTDLERAPEPPFREDGQLDAGYVEVATSAGGSIWAGIDGNRLYLATQPASSGRDRFLVVSLLPGSPEPAMWAKSGDVASYDAYIGNESTNGWTGWFDAVSPGGPVAGAVLEGSIDLADQYGALPPSIYVAALGFETEDGAPLDPSLQVPAGNGDFDVTPDEFVEIVLADLIPSGCVGDLDGDGSTALGDLGVFASNFGQTVPPNTGGDFDGDGEVTLTDFGVFAADFGCAP